MFLTRADLEYINLFLQHDRTGYLRCSSARGGTPRPPAGSRADSLKLSEDRYDILLRPPLHVFSGRAKYSVMQSDRNSSCRDVVLDSFDMAYWDEDSI